MSKVLESHLYREVRLDLDHSDRGETVAIILPTSNSTSFLSRPQQKRTIRDESYVGLDENTFARQHLASEASIYFRALDKYPRCLLWRLLDNRKVLEIRSVDTTRKIGRETGKEKADVASEASIIFQLGFPAQIKPFGVALADLEDRDAIAIFALTTTYELYTITLTRAFFSKVQASEQDASAWCKISTPSCFSFRYPYRLVAASALELWISLHDGGLLHLTRNTGDDGSTWHETFFAEGGWGSSFKGLISWRGQNTIRFGNIDLASATAAALAVSPDKSHLFTVCLNHTLKAWNLNTGKVGVQRDLLGEALDTQKANQYVISTSQPHLLQIVSVPRPKAGDLYYVLTYSPKQHQFKFWGIRDADDIESGIYDIQGGFHFVPPIDELMNTTVWNLEEFHVDASAGWQNAQIWIRARTGLNSSTYTMSFDLFGDHSDVNDAWTYEWASVDSGPLTVGQLRTNTGYPGLLPVANDISNHWLEFLTLPGRFSVPTLETALSIYQAGLGHRVIPTSKGPLKERLTSAIASSLAFQKQEDGSSDYDRFAHDAHHQWQVFYGVVQDLHKRRGESLSLSYDHGSNSPWLVLADYVTPLRANSELELLSDNHRLLHDQQKAEQAPPECLEARLNNRHALHISEILHAAQSFRRRLPPSFQAQLKKAVLKEVFQEPWTAVSVRIGAFEELCELAAYAGEDDMSRLDKHLDLLSSMDEEFYERLLDLFSEQEHDKPLKRQVNQIGRQHLLRASEEILESQTEQLLDLLILTTYIAMYWSPDDTPEQFKSEQLFVTIIEKLRHHLLLKWLSSTTLPSHRSRESSTSVLWNMVGRDASNVRFVQTRQESSAEMLTTWARAWVFAPFGSSGPPFTDITEDIMVSLLQEQAWDLAMDFQRFLGGSPWATYLRGRLCLARAEFTRAAKHFMKAAPGLSLELPKLQSFRADVDRQGLIAQSDAKFFCDGLPNFYFHIMDLFETAKAYSFVTDFANLGLQNPSLVLAEDSESLTAGLLSRLFTATLHCSRYNEAYSALVRQNNGALRKTNLTALITTMTGQGQSAALLRLPLATLSNDVDAILESLCHKTLNITTGPPYHKILYSYRISRGDFRGAATILYERLQRLRSASGTSDDALTQGYLILINTLASVSPEQAWIFAEGRVEEQGIFGGGTATIGKSRDTPKRKVVTLDDVRREYEKELDRQSAMENGRFAFGEETDAMDLM